MNAPLVLQFFIVLFLSKVILGAAHKLDFQARGGCGIHQMSMFVNVGEGSSDCPQMGSMGKVCCQGGIVVVLRMMKQFNVVYGMLLFFKRVILQSIFV